MKIRTLLVVLTIVAAALGLAACAKKTTTKTSEDKKEGGKKVVIYSGRKENLIKPVLKAFEKKTGIKATLLAGDSSQLANQIIEEQKNPRADVYISNDAGTLGYLSLKGGLEKYQSPSVDAVPENLKASDGTWVGASVRARVIMYNTNLVKLKEVPRSIFDLTDPKWKGQFAVAGSANESMSGHISSIRIIKGDEPTEKWLRDLMANEPVVTKGHSPIRKAVGTGELKLGLVNHYYFHAQKDEGSPVGVIYPDQGKDDIGTFINVAGVGIIRGAKNKEAAEKFVDFVLGSEAQKIFAGENKEMPVLKSVPTVDAKSLVDFKQAKVRLDRLGEELDRTMDLLEKVGMQ